LQGVKQNSPTLQGVKTYLPFLFLLAVKGLNVMMRALVSSNNFTGYNISLVAPTVVSHLQFAKHTLLKGVKSRANVRALRAILVLFEAVSGMKVNFHKSMLVGVNVVASWLSEVAADVSRKNGFVVPGVGCSVRRGGREGDGRRAGSGSRRGSREGLVMGWRCFFGWICG
jgi:hypothetical protein